MEQLWYYEDHGRAKGPVSTRDLINKIQKGEMTLMDLVFKEGQHQWMPLESFSEITELIGNITLNEAADWIVLKSVNVDGKNVHEQIGPFNAQQILDLLDKGRIRFSDYVWRTGYEKWVPLGRVDQFEKPLKSSVEVDKSLYTKPRHYDLLHEAQVAKEAPLKKVTPVAVAQPEKALGGEPKPEDAKGEDLAAPKWKTEAQIVNRTEVITTPTPAPAPRATAAAPERTEKQKPKKREERPREEKQKEPAPKKEAKRIEPAPKKEEELSLAEELERERAQQIANLTPAEPKKTSVESLKPTGAGARSGSVEHAQKAEDDLLVLDIKSSHRDQTASSRANLKVDTVGVEQKKPENELKAHVSRKWIQVGMAACVVAIIFAAGILMFMGKKKLDATPQDSFSIKVDQNPETISRPKAPVVPRQQVKKQDIAKQPIAPKQNVADASKNSKAGAPMATGDTATASGAAKTTAAEKSKEEDTTPTIGGSFKNRSYYHHKERIYLFYTSNEGEALASDLQKASKKHLKSSKNWKSFYGGWKGKAKNYSSKVGKEAKKARLHRTLFRQLATSAGQLEDLGRDLNAQISDGRTPSKVASAKNIESQFKSISSTARNLDR